MTFNGQNFPQDIKYSRGSFKYKLPRKAYLLVTLCARNS